MNKWYQSQDLDNIIISNRIRLARNVKDFNFPTKMDRDQAISFIHKMKDTAEKLEEYQLECIELDGLESIEKRAMIERHIISPYLYHKSLPGMVILNKEEDISIMVNEEDHLRIQGVNGGDDIISTWQTINKLDDDIEEYLPYAYSEKYGYMTACPTNLGTGLRASYMLHLPLLERTKYLEELLVDVGKLGMSIRGIYGEGTRSLASIYQISNQKTLGRTEEEIIESMQNITRHIVDKEENIRDNVTSTLKSKLKDQVYRSYGILAYARQLTLSEAMNLLSDVKLGFEMGLYDMPRPKKPSYEIMIMIQNATISSKLINQEEKLPTDIVRANIIRKYLKEDI